MTWRFVLASIALFVAGCGGAAGDTGSGGETSAESGATTGEPMGSCPVADPELAPVSFGEAASTLAAVHCQALADCACEVEGFSTVPSCRHGANMYWEDVRDEALAGGLVYDGACLASAAEMIRTDGCTTDPELAAGFVGPGFCAVFHGDRPLGASCEAMREGLSNCAQGLACWNGACADPCAVDEVGGRQSPYDFACPAGQVSSRYGCVVGLGEDDNCSEAACAPGLLCVNDCPGGDDCTGQWYCRPPADLGSPCYDSEDCASGFCLDQLCEQGPAEGEPCVDGRCPLGIACEGGTCTGPAALICALGPP